MHQAVQGLREGLVASIKASGPCCQARQARSSCTLPSDSPTVHFQLHFKSCWEPGPGALQHWQLIQDKRSLGWQPAVCSAPQMPVLAPCMTGRFNSPGSLESQDPSAHRKTWTGFAFIHTSVQMGKAGLDAAGRKKEKNQLSIAGNAGVLIRPINKGSL